MSDRGQSERATVRLSRVFRASPGYLFDCFTDPALVMRWWGPEGASCPNPVNDLVVGGEFRFDIVWDDSGRVNALHGKYLEIDPPRRLVFTWTWDDTPEEVTRVEVTLRAINEQETELTLVHDRFPNAERAEEHREGWTSSLDCLQTAVNHKPPDQG
jgi:uncharacterized protein YndB with AHSA1/START domain